MVLKTKDFTISLVKNFKEKCTLTGYRKKINLIFHQQGFEFYH